LTSDIESVAWPVSHWVRTSGSADEISYDAAEAIGVAKSGPGRISTLILPADTAWNNTDKPVAEVPSPEKAVAPESGFVSSVAEIIRSGEPVLLLLGRGALRETPLEWASAITAAAPNVKLLAESSNARMERGAGRGYIDRVAYVVDLALDMLSGFRHAVLVEANDPVAFFAYPGKPSRLLPESCQLHELAGTDGDGPVALEMLADALGARGVKPDLSPYSPPPLVKGPLDPMSIGSVIANAIPENAIVVDESITTGRAFFPMTQNANPHTWLQLSGGAIGIGIPLSIGAAIAAPERPVLTLQADGSAMFTQQGLWTQAREGLNVTTIIFHNRSYKILLGEMHNVGVDNPGPSAMDMLEIDRPVIDWLAIARGFGVEGGRATDAEMLLKEIRRGLACEGPYLIEAVM